MTSPNTIVSIIIPCYNQAKFLPDAIKSLQTQTYPHWECIIINDGSTDNTQSVAETLAQSDPRVRVVKQKNTGLSGARNTGLNEVRGKYIQFLDSDDILLPEKLEQQVIQLQTIDSPALSICHYYYCAEEDIQKRVYEDLNLSPDLNLQSPLSDLIIRWENDGLSIPIHCFLFDTHLFKQQNIQFNTRLANHEDWDCWVNIFALYPKVFMLDKELVAYRVHDTSMSQVNYKSMHRGFLKAIKRQQVRFKDQPEFLKLLLAKETKVKLRYKQQQEALAFEKKKHSKWIKFYKQNTPWPIQKVISKFF